MLPFILNFEGNMPASVFFQSEVYHPKSMDGMMWATPRTILCPVICVKVLPK